MMTKTVYINDIFESPPTNSGLKKRDIYLEKEDESMLPVYSASKDKNFIFGWVKKDSKWKSYENLLTWNKDGTSSGRVFYRKEEFVPYEKVKLLRLKKNIKNELDYEYLRIIIENKLLSLGFDFRLKCAMERVLNVKIKIPIDDKGNFDLDKQKELSEKYNKFSVLKNNIREIYEEIKNVRVSLEENYKTKELLISEIFNQKKGNAKYTKKYINNHGGKYPIYSSQTIKEGIIGYIDTYDYDTNGLNWTTDGIYAGTVFYRDGKFSMTTHSGLLKTKTEYKDSINLKFVSYQLNHILKDYALGEGNKRITIKIIKNVPIKLPVNKNNDIDLNQQKKLAEKYEKLQNVKYILENKLKNILTTKVSILN